MEEKSMAPVIGVTVDSLELGPPSDFLYNLRQNYISALSSAGAHAVMLPLDEQSIDRYACLCDGFLVTGSLPGDPGSARRQAFDIKIVRKALETQMPILGICNGMQMIGLSLDGYLLERISRSDKQRIDHNPRKIPDQVAHQITLKPGSLLSQLACQSDNNIQFVNSLHTQALSVCGQFKVVAKALDGLVEAIEVPDHPFALGVQWHPEYLLSTFDSAIFTTFVSRCESRRKRPL